MTTRVASLKRAIAAIPGAADVVFKGPNARVGELRLSAEGLHGVDLRLLQRAAPGCRLILSGESCGRVDLYIPFTRGREIGAFLAVLGVLLVSVGTVCLFL
jgi:hypothetical protein